MTYRNFKQAQAQEEMTYLTRTLKAYGTYRAAGKYLKMSASSLHSRVKYLQKEVKK